MIVKLQLSFNSATTCSIPDCRGCSIRTRFRISSIPQHPLCPWRGTWIDQMDYNVYYGTGPLSDSADNLAQWQEQGFDEHSVNADPMFVNPTNGDYRVKPESPALKLGFENFDVSRCGLLPDFPKK